MADIIAGVIADIIGPTSHYFYSQRLKLHYVDWGKMTSRWRYWCTADATIAATGIGSRSSCASTSI